MLTGAAFSGLEPRGPWSGRAVYAAGGPLGRVFLLGSAGAAAAAAPGLLHQNLPERLGETELEIEGAGRRFQVYRWFDAVTLEEALAGGRTFTEFEALNIVYETARALKYLHGLVPPVPHGAVGPGSVLLCAGRVALAPPLAAGSAAADYAGLGALLRLLAKHPRRGRFSFQYFKAADYIQEPGGGADYAIKVFEALAAKPDDALPPPARPRRLPRVTPAAAAAAALVLASALWLGYKARYELLPRLAPGRLAAGGAAKAGDYPCAALPPPAGPPREGENLVVNPSLEGPCGWSAQGGFRRGTIRRRGARSGGYYFSLSGRGKAISQEVDVSAFLPYMKAGRCSAEVSGWLKSRSGGEAGACLYACALSSDEDCAGEGVCNEGRGSGWNGVSLSLPLPEETRRVRLELRAAGAEGAWFKRDAAFDDISVSVLCR